MKLRPPPPKKKARVEIIPLIDVVFFCLATFILVSLSMTSQPGVRVNLPESTTSVPHELGSTVTLTITDKNQLFWDKDTVTWDMFLIKLDRFKRQCDQDKKEAHVLFNADLRAHYGQCVSMLDEIRKAGIEKVSIETRVKTTAN
jgi:biopolymer transport protein ExbD